MKKLLHVCYQFIYIFKRLFKIAICLVLKSKSILLLANFIFAFTLATIFPTQHVSAEKSESEELDTKITDPGQDSTNLEAQPDTCGNTAQIAYNKCYQVLKGDMSNLDINTINTIIKHGANVGKTRGWYGSEVGTIVEQATSMLPLLATQQEQTKKNLAICEQARTTCMATCSQDLKIYDDMNTQCENKARSFKFDTTDSTPRLGEDVSSNTLASMTGGFNKRLSGEKTTLECTPNPSIANRPILTEIDLEGILSPGTAFIEPFHSQENVTRATHEKNLNICTNDYQDKINSFFNIVSYLAMGADFMTQILALMNPEDKEVGCGDPSYASTNVEECKGTCENLQSQYFADNAQKCTEELCGDKFFAYNNQGMCQFSCEHVEGYKAENPVVCGVDELPPPGGGPPPGPVADTTATTPETKKPETSTKFSKSSTGSTTGGGTFDSTADGIDPDGDLLGVTPMFGSGSGSGGGQSGFAGTGSGSSGGGGSAGFGSRGGSGAGSGGAKKSGALGSGRYYGKALGSSGGSGGRRGGGKRGGRGGSGLKAYMPGGDKYRNPASKKLTAKQKNKKNGITGANGPTIFDKINRKYKIESYKLRP